MPRIGPTCECTHFHSDNVCVDEDIGVNGMRRRGETMPSRPSDSREDLQREAKLAPSLKTFKEQM